MTPDTQAPVAEPTAPIEAAPIAAAPAPVPAPDVMSMDYKDGKNALLQMLATQPIVAEVAPAEPAPEPEPTPEAGTPAAEAVPEVHAPEPAPIPANPNPPDDEDAPDAQGRPPQFRFRPQAEDKLTIQTLKLVKAGLPADKAVAQAKELLGISDGPAAPAPPAVSSVDLESQIEALELREAEQMADWTTMQAAAETKKELIALRKQHKQAIQAERQQVTAQRSQEQARFEASCSQATTEFPEFADPNSNFYTTCQQIDQEGDPRLQGPDKPVLIAREAAARLYRAGQTASTNSRPKAATPVAPVATPPSPAAPQPPKPKQVAPAPIGGGHSSVSSAPTAELLAIQSIDAMHDYHAMKRRLGLGT